MRFGLRWLRRLTWIGMAPFLTPVAEVFLHYPRPPLELDGCSLANAKRAVAMLAARDVPILAGTDTGNMAERTC